MPLNPAKELTCSLEGTQKLLNAFKQQRLLLFSRCEKVHLGWKGLKLRDGQWAGIRANEYAS